MVYGNRRKRNIRKLMVAIFALGMLVSSFISIMKVHDNNIPAEQTTKKNIDNVTGNRTSIINNTLALNPQVDSEVLFDLENIPFFMKDYFEWHGRQLEQMKEDAEKSNKNGSDSEENDAYLSKYRFLVLRCAASKQNGKANTVEDRCGGLSDRLKPFPLFLWYAAKSNRILFIRWGKNRPAPIETFMKPGDFWNWTFPDVMLRKIEKLEESASSDNSFTRVYFDGTPIQHKKLLDIIGDQDVWMVEGNDFTGGRSRYEDFVRVAIEAAPASISDHSPSNSDIFSISKLRPEDALYETFYHDLFHATFRPSTGVKTLLDAYFQVPTNDSSSVTSSWLPVPLQRNHYAVAHYRAQYPKEPYRETQNRTILRETTIHAVECAKSRVSGSKLLNNPHKNLSLTSTLVSAIYVASDTALVVETVHDEYHNQNARPFEENADPMKSINVWTYLDLQSYNSNKYSGDGDGLTMKTKQTITLAEDPPHLNFAQRDDVSAFYVIFVDLFLMSYASCVVFGAGGFGRLGSLVSYRPLCGMAYTVNHGNLQQCDPYD